LQWTMDLAAVRGPSSWLTTLALNEHGCALHKSAFQDALALRYGGLLFVPLKFVPVVLPFQ